VGSEKGENVMRRLTIVLGLVLAAGCDGSSTTGDDPSESMGGDGGGTCTLAGCDSSFTVELADELGPGQYHLEVVTEEGTGVCDLTVLAGGGEVMLSCSGDFELGMGPSSIGIHGNPNSVAITLEETGSGQIAEAEFEDPEYTEQFPNGPNCGSCFQGVEQLPALVDPMTP